jgi:hypothetical protein
LEILQIPDVEWRWSASKMTVLTSSAPDRCQISARVKKKAEALLANSLATVPSIVRAHAFEHPHYLALAGAVRRISSDRDWDRTQVFGCESRVCLKLPFDAHRSFA